MGDYDVSPAHVELEKRQVCLVSLMNPWHEAIDQLEIVQVIAVSPLIGRFWKPERSTDEPGPVEHGSPRIQDM